MRITARGEARKESDDSDDMGEEKMDENYGYDGAFEVVEVRNNKQYGHAGHSHPKAGLFSAHCQRECWAY